MAGDIYCAYRSYDMLSDSFFCNCALYGDACEIEGCPGCLDDDSNCGACGHIGHCCETCDDPVWDDPQIGVELLSDGAPVTSYYVLPEIAMKLLYAGCWVTILLCIAITALR